MSDKFIRLLATVFYVGKFPLAPGSLASAAGALLAILIGQRAGVYLIVFAAVTAVGFLVSGRMERLTGQKDHPSIVIDEVAGALLALFYLPVSPAVSITAFFLFRAFDMFKIPPADVLEEKPGGVGVMMDDLIAGLYANLVMQAAVRLAGVLS